MRRLPDSPIAIAAWALPMWLAACSGSDSSKPSTVGSAAAGGSSNVPALSAGTGTGLIPSSGGTGTSTAPVSGSSGAIAGTGSASLGAGRGSTLPPAAGVGVTTPVAGTVAPPPAAGTSAPPAPPPAWNTAGKTCLQAGSGKFGEPGPYKVGKMDVDLGMIQASQASGKFTIFYPMPLETACLHPIVAWGNGTGVADSTTYAFFNSNAASWGMVVIASWENNSGSGAFHKAGIDYLLKQNADPMSMFYKKLSTRAGTSGHSQGAGGATQGSTHPNVQAEVAVGGPGSTAAKVAMLCLTGTEDIAATSCPGQIDRGLGPAFAASWQGGDHVTTETLAGYITKDAGSLQMQRLYAAWFRCYLADDGVACGLFKGWPDSCGVCKDMGWAMLKAKNVN
jgi:hypothetical protein